MSDYQVTIQMDQATVEALAAAGGVLGGLAGAQCAATGLPALYFVSSVLSLSTTVTFSPSYLAYASTTAAAAGSVVTVGSAYAVQPGGTLQVTDATGDGTVLPPATNSTPASPITITSTTAFPSSGLALAGVDAPVATCSFPLAAGTPNVITPQPLLYLSLWVPSGTPDAAGTALSTSLGPGILVNLAQNGAPVVTYQYPPPGTGTTYGWSWASDVAGVTAYDVGQDLVSLLNASAT